MTLVHLGSDAADQAASLAYQVADSLLAQRGKSFHWARRLLSAPHAERATRLYGFCRRIDDLVDENTSASAAHTALASVRQALLCDCSDDAAWCDMLNLMRESDIDPAIPLELIRGVAGDLDTVCVADMPELLRYCYRVAGTVGQMMTALLDVSAPEATPHAIHLGIAMQLTNICRDVREDALRGRRYLPATLVGALEPASLVAPTGATRATAAKAVCALLDLAETYYASAEHGLHYLPAGARAGILVASRLYREIGEVLRKRDGDCWSSRAMVGAAGKTVVTLRALRDLRDLGDLGDSQDSGDSGDSHVSDKSTASSRLVCSSAMAMAMAMAMPTGTLNRHCGAVSVGLLSPRQRSPRLDHAN